jgi:hypothetical protein
MAWKASPFQQVRRPVAAVAAAARLSAQFRSPDEPGRRGHRAVLAAIADSRSALRR